MEKVLEPGLARRQVHDLSALLALYEANYLRFMRLIPELERLQGTVVSQVSGALDLYLSILHRYRYTTEVQLTYRFGANETGVLEPAARICVYHDAHAAELVAHCRRRRYAQDKPLQAGTRMPLLERKWEMNRFLYKWLRYCHYQGHLFLGSTCASREPFPVARSLRCQSSITQPFALSDAASKADSIRKNP